MKFFLKRFLCMVLIALFCFLMMACPSRVDLEKVQKESGKISKATHDIENAVEAMVDNNIVSVARAKSFFNESNKLITYGQASDEFFVILKNKYGDLTKVSRADVPIAVIKFLDVVKAFAIMLGELKLIPMLNQKILDAIEIIKLAVTFAAKIFQKQAEVENIIGPPLKELGV